MSTEPPLAEPQETPNASPHPWPAPVAPAWHTLLFLVVIFAFSALSANSQHEMVQHYGRVRVYAVTMAWEYILVGFILWGTRKKGTRLRELVGGRWKSPEDFLIDLGIAVGFWALAAAILAALSFALGLASPSQIEAAKKQIVPLLPRNGLELGIWIAVSVTAGFCEEIMFRGYLQKQFHAATRSQIAAVVLQGAVFGVAHAYQGGRRVILIGVYGALFGILAATRKSLRPGMVAHTLQDSFSGFAARLLK